MRENRLRYVVENLTLSASDLSKHLWCRHLTALDLAAATDPDFKRPPYL